MAKTREIRKRIASVRNIHKITHTMERVAQSKVVKLNTRIAAARAFRADLARLLPEALGAALGTSQAHEALAAIPLTAPRAAPTTGSRIMLFVVTSSRGLCGAYNARVLQATRARMQDLSRAGMVPVLAVMGKKGLSYFRYHNQPVEIAMSDSDENLPFAGLLEVFGQAAALYTSRSVAALELVSTRYRTKAVQEVVIRRLLPFDFTLPAGAAAAGPATIRRGGDKSTSGAEEALYFVEPTRHDVLAALVPLAAGVELFCAVLEAMLGEQAQRSLAMRSASDNADSMTKKLTRTYNRARQAQITSEMIEIISGSEGGRE